MTGCKQRPLSLRSGIAPRRGRPPAGEAARSEWPGGSRGWGSPPWFLLSLAIHPIYTPTAAPEYRRSVARPPPIGFAASKPPDGPFPTWHRPEIALLFPFGQNRFLAPIFARATRGATTTVVGETELKLRPQRTMAARTFFPRFPKEQVEAAMAVRRAAESTRAEAAWLARPGGALQQLLRSDSEIAADKSHAVKQAAGAYREVLQRYGDGDGGVTVGSVRDEPFPVAHSAHPRCEPCRPRLGGSRCSWPQPVTSPCVLRRQMMAHAMFARPPVNSGPTALAVRARVPQAWWPLRLVPGRLILGFGHAGGWARVVRDGHSQCGGPAPLDAQPRRRVLTHARGSPPQPPPEP